MEKGLILRGRDVAKLKFFYTEAIGVDLCAQRRGRGAVGETVSISSFSIE